MIQGQKKRVAKSLTIGQYFRLWKTYIFNFGWRNTNLELQLHLRRADPDLLSVVTSKCKAFVRAQIGLDGPPQPHLLPPAPFKPPCRTARRSQPLWLCDHAQLLPVPAPGKGASPCCPQTHFFHHLKLPFMLCVSLASGEPFKA